MSKNKDQKRKAQLATRAKNESFRFQAYQGDGESDTF